jgi:acyl-homoserine-lactone acylase
MRLPFLALFSLLTLFSYSQNTYPIIDPSDVKIIRDSFGVPHIFGKTDAHCAYGLAWTNAEDAFHETQNLIYIAKGFMGRKDGLEGVKADFFVHAIGARKTVEEKYENDLTPAFKKYFNGYMQGINAYAKAYPEKVKIKKAFPVNEYDLMTAFLATMSFLSNAQGAVGDAVGGKYDQEKIDFNTNQPPVGSNAYAARSAITKEGKTFLCINPHLQMNGPFSFYEMHMQSEEGLDMQGVTFQGATSHAMGANKHLGWGFTWNYFDKLDVFKLEMHPKKKGYYKFDNEHIKLERRPVWLKVKVKGLIIPVKKMTYWSNYGCTVKSDKSDNYYSIRFPANMTVKTGQQLYEMSKSKNYDEFWTAMRSNHGVALFNMVYADDQDNIFYLSHGMLPDRKDLKYNWSGIVPGNTSKTLWTSLVPLDSMPKNINPECNYVFNANNNVYHATCIENSKSCNLPDYVNERPGDNNRAITLKNFFNENPTFSYNQFKKIKYETKFPPNSKFIKSLDPLWNLSSEKYPDLKEEIDLIKNWDRNTDVNSVATSLFGAFIKRIFDERKYGDNTFITGITTLTEEQTVEYLRKSSEYLKKYFGTIYVRWGDIHKLRRGNKSIEIESFADLLSPSYPEEKIIDGKLEFNPKYGDTYCMFVKFGTNGAELIETLEPLGNSLNPDSPHYTDQMEIFTKKQHKYMPFEKNYWESNALKIYNLKK